MRRGTRLVLTAFPPIYTDTPAAAAARVTTILYAERAQRPAEFPAGRYRVTIYDAQHEPELGTHVELAAADLAYGT